VKGKGGGALEGGVGKRDWVSMGSDACTSKLSVFIFHRFVGLHSVRFGCVFIPLYLFLLSCGLPVSEKGGLGQGMSGGWGWNTIKCSINQMNLPYTQRNR